MSAKDFDEMGIDNYVVYREHKPWECDSQSHNANYVPGHRYFIVTRYISSGTRHAYIMDSCGRTYDFSSCKGYQLEWWRSEFLTYCNKVYHGKTFQDALNFVSRQVDAEHYED